jgi:hypothetical protein
LIITGAHIVDDGIAGNIVQGAFAGDIMTVASDDKGEFRLIVDLLRGAWDENGCTGSDYTIVVLGEQRRYLGDLLARLLGVVAVIEAQENQLPRSWDWGLERHLATREHHPVTLQSFGLLSGAELLPHVPLGLADGRQRSFACL